MSTVNFALDLPNGQPYIGRVTLRPLSTPLANGGRMVVEGEIVASTDVNGLLSQELAAGLYKVFLGSSSKGITIRVPAGLGTYNHLDLLTTQLESSGLYAWSPGSAVPQATETVPGAVTLSEGAESSVAAAAVGPNHRWKDGNLQLRNPDTGLFHNFFPKGTGTSITTGWGDGEE